MAPDVKSPPLFRIWDGTKMVFSGFMVSPEGKVYKALDKELWEINFPLMHFLGYDQDGNLVYEGDKFLEHIGEAPVVAMATPSSTFLNGRVCGHIYEKEG